MLRTSCTYANTLSKVSIDSLTLICLFEHCLFLLLLNKRKIQIYLNQLRDQHIERMLNNLCRIMSLIGFFYGASGIMFQSLKARFPPNSLNHALYQFNINLYQLILLIQPVLYHTRIVIHLLDIMLVLFCRENRRDGKKSYNNNSNNTEKTLLMNEPSYCCT